MPWASKIWRTLLRPTEQQGFVIVAQGKTYLECAQRLSDSVRRWHPEARICLITDQDTTNTAFDHVRVLQTPNQENPWANDWQVFRLTPFRENIKLEADMLITSEISHWWTQLRHRDLVISLGCRDWQDQVSNVRSYRRVFDENNLPDVYNAITYWRLSATAREFFDLVRDIFQNWDQFRTLIQYADLVPSTDLVYALAAEIMGRDRVTMPWATYPRMVHMKQHIANAQHGAWQEEMVWEYHNGRLRVNSVAQWGAFHYHTKDWKP
jgi:hypothetical protein